MDTPRQSPSPTASASSTWNVGSASKADAVACVNMDSEPEPDFSFADYIIRCMRIQIVQLLHISWKSWAVVLTVLILNQVWFGGRAQRRLNCEGIDAKAVGVGAGRWMAQVLGERCAGLGQGTAVVCVCVCFRQWPPRQQGCIGRGKGVGAPTPTPFCAPSLRTSRFLPFSIFPLPEAGRNRNSRSEFFCLSLLSAFLTAQDAVL